MELDKTKTDFEKYLYRSNKLFKIAVTKLHF